MEDLILYLMNNGFDLTFIPAGAYTEVEVVDCRGNLLVVGQGEDMEEALYHAISRALIGERICLN
jgi:hypothetical protein